MKKTLIFAAAATLGIAALAATSTGGAGATKPDDDGGHKVWICHVVEGQGELKNGYNLIEVDEAAIESEGHQNHVSKDGRRDIIPAPYGAQSRCLVPDPPNRPPVETDWTGPEPSCAARERGSDPHRDDVLVHVRSSDLDVRRDGDHDPADADAEPDRGRGRGRVTSRTRSRSRRSFRPPAVRRQPVTPAAVTPTVEAAAVTVATAPTGTLPTTGGETLAIFLVGLATLLAGAGLVTWSRRTA